MSLITIGFATIMRRAQRQALDQQLSSQAFYAAESALSIKAEELRKVIEGPGLTAANNIDTCSAQSPFGVGAEEIRSTCVLVDTTPDDLNFRPVSSKNSTVVRSLKAKSGNPFQKLVITWQMSGAGGNLCSNHSSLPNSMGSDDIGMIRMDLTSLSSFTRSDLISRTFSAVLNPQTGGVPSKPFGTAQDTETPTMYGSCAGNEASAEIDFGGVDQNGAFVLRLLGLYKPSNVTVTGVDGSGNQVEFDGAQIIIDSTARVQDVIRRIQVRMPVNTAGILPDFALRTTDSICKMMLTRDGDTINKDNCN
jgi:hypothetical protein